MLWVLKIMDKKKYLQFYAKFLFETLRNGWRLLSDIADLTQIVI